MLEIYRGHINGLLKWSKRATNVCSYRNNKSIQIYEIVGALKKLVYDTRNQDNSKYRVGFEVKNISRRQVNFMVSTKLVFLRASIDPGEWTPKKWIEYTVAIRGLFESNNRLHTPNAKIIDEANIIGVDPAIGEDEGIVSRKEKTGFTFKKIQRC